MSRAYYNDIDPKACAWLRELIAEGLIAPGDVDGRSIADVTADDIRGYTQCHFFAGIGGWSLALRLAGWPDNREVWTGSCPCQPFSTAGKRKGVNDPRHVWPEFARLIGECRPPAVFGEQVASKDGRLWLAGVFTDLEELGYSVAGADLCAAGVGAPHIRQRLWWVADSIGGRRDGRTPDTRERTERGTATGGAGKGGGMADASSQRRQQEPRGSLGDEVENEGWEAQGDHEPASGGKDRRLADSAGRRRQQRHAEQRTVQEPGPDGTDGWLGDTDGQRRDGLDSLRGAERGIEVAGTGGGLGNSDQQRSQGRDAVRCSGHQSALGSPGLANPWSNTIWLPCSDGKARRIEPSIEPLVDGLPGRVGLLRGAGNAIVPQVAATFIGCVMDVLDSPTPAPAGFFGME